MKTTVEIPEDLLEEAKAMAAEERLTLRALIEDGLRHVLARRRTRRERFVLRDAAVSGEGVRDGLDEGDWDRMRDRIYDGRGS